ncbi:MAG: acyltransferase [Clostridia bacterium]|nr:acyltransferase [Clostridia bacterium]
MGKIKNFIKKLLNKDSNSELEYLIGHGLKMGKNSTIHSGCTIDSGWPWLIEIGDNVCISSNVTILAHDYSPNIVGCGTKLGRVVIGNNVFIGTRSIVLCNVRIGNDVIVGSGSVVTHDLQSGAVYAGSPARRICSIEEYKEKMQGLRKNAPNFSNMRPWDTWREAPIEEKKYMVESLKDTMGFL